MPDHLKPVHHYIGLKYCSKLSISVSCSTMKWTFNGRIHISFFISIFFVNNLQQRIPNQTNTPFISFINFRGPCILENSLKLFTWILFDNTRWCRIKTRLYSTPKLARKYYSCKPQKIQAEHCWRCNQPIIQYQKNRL